MSKLWDTKSCLYETLIIMWQKWAFIARNKARHSKIETYFIKESCTIIKTNENWNINQVPLDSYRKAKQLLQTESLCGKFGQNVHQATKSQLSAGVAFRPEWKASSVIPDSIKTKMLSPPLLINEALMVELAQFWSVEILSRASTGRWSHESLSTENTLKNKHCAPQDFIFFISGIKPTYSTQYFKVKWAGTWNKFVLS